MVLKKCCVPYKPVEFKYSRKITHIVPVDAKAMRILAFNRAIYCESR